MSSNLTMIKQRLLAKLQKRTIGMWAARWKKGTDNFRQEKKTTQRLKDVGGQKASLIENKRKNSGQIWHWSFYSK